jgi:hypothetical protein
MSILNDRNYLGGLLRYNYGNNLIIMVTEYDAKKNHTIKSQGKPGFTPSPEFYPLGLAQTDRG